MTNLDQNSFHGFERAAEEAFKANLQQIDDLDNPEERRRIRTLLNSWGKDKIVINALASGMGIDESKIPWTSQYAIDSFRQGEDDIHGALEEGAEKFPEESTQGLYSTNIGIEYEMNVPGIFDFSDENNEITGDHRSFFVKNNGSLLVDQETGPRTLEIVSDVYPSIDAAVDSLMRREEFAEHFLENNQVDGLTNKPIRKHSGQHQSYHPGVHIHLDPEEEANTEALEDLMLYYSPQMAFLTANNGSENFSFNGKDYISSRQAKTIGGGYPNGNVVYTDRDTIELRVPDIQGTREDWKATVASTIGLTKYAEAQGFGPSPRIESPEAARDAIETYYNDLQNDGEVAGGRTFDDIMEDLEGNEHNFNIDCRIKDYLSHGPPEDEMDEFLEAIEIGLHLTGYDTDHYMGIIEDKVDRQYNKL